MYTSVWVVTFMNLQYRQYVLGVYSTREKAIQAVERAADDHGEWLDRTWLNYSSRRGVAPAYDDESLKYQAGTYEIIMHDLQ